MTQYCTQETGFLLLYSVYLTRWIYKCPQDYLLLQETSKKRTRYVNFGNSTKHHTDSIRMHTAQAGETNLDAQHSITKERMTTQRQVSRLAHTVL